MDLKYTYLNEVPDISSLRNRSYISDILGEFMKSDKPAMKIDLGDHYTGVRSAASTWDQRVKKLGYRVAVKSDSKNNCLYLVKKKA